jgi:hypothetical protein
MIFILIFLIGIFVGMMVWSMQDYIRNTRFHGGDLDLDVWMQENFYAFYERING